MAELRMLGLEIDAEPVCANLLGADRADRAYRHARESALDGVADTLGLRELDYVSDLIRAGENRDVHRAGRDRVQRRTQWSAIGRQRPSVDRNYRNARASRLKPRGQFVIGDAVFLHRDSFTLQIDLRRERTHHFAPGIRLWHDDRRLEAEIAYRTNRFRPARDGYDLGQRRDERRTLVSCLHRGEQRARADAGHEDYSVELATEQAVGEIQRSVIVLERNLAHRRRDNRDAAAPFDHGRDFSRHPALERDDAQSGEAGRDVRGIGLCLRVHRERPIAASSILPREGYVGKGRSLY